ncbi:MAG: hypothetical protein Ct9H300mP18_10230 [Candidatus Neomarinimicrobiota bacterium]|nr:MAG: hypothetical protein Ct9H300mP18_10230 [Candidatus Neomarinimicrobiota bacterium]
MHDPKGRDFDLYLINIDGTDLERITYFEGLMVSLCLVQMGNILFLHQTVTKINLGHKYFYLRMEISLICIWPEIGRIYRINILYGYT